MQFEEILKELQGLTTDEVAKLIAFLVPKCLPTKETYKDYYYRYYPFWEKNGFHLTLNHFYSPIPEIYKLKKELWEQPKNFNINFNENEAMILLDEFYNKFKLEYDKIPIAKTQDPKQYYLTNEKFEGIDGYILYCMIRHFKPKRIIEIGSGNSTILSSQACMINKEKHKIDTEIITIDPYPNEILNNGIPNVTQIIKKRAQDVSLDFFDKLEAGDFLFIDSSHVLKIDSDVKYEYTEIMPRLKNGVIIHIHDIFTPAEYPKEFIYGLLFLFNEQYLVEAILANSSNFKIIWAGQFMYLNHLEKIMSVFENYKEIKQSPRHFSSLWLQKGNINT